ncbi:hypothetical protein [Burkholderia cenocepacia]|uniref:hypothetical protein n=1 Tax=Burkholderia cenocepacia TaxID=95486 RepID=UPI00076C0A63|nr:hypothetical protein [Burkholderia cenocepacia]KWU26331.1 hypothetical protein AS149_25415 [Burkholderia cenocepacia]
MADSLKLAATSISCPVCSRGRAFLFEERIPAQRHGAEPGEGIIEVRSRFRLCDTCEVEFAGVEESRFNKEQVLAAQASNGGMHFPGPTSEPAALYA